VGLLNFFFSLHDTVLLYLLIRDSISDTMVHKTMGSDKFGCVPILIDYTINFFLSNGFRLCYFFTVQLACILMPCFDKKFMGMVINTFCN
jgi:hypothetical protein